jgi:hypothetical protein
VALEKARANAQAAFEKVRASSTAKPGFPQSPAGKAPAAIKKEAPSRKSSWHSAAELGGSEIPTATGPGAEAADATEETEKETASPEVRKKRKSRTKAADAKKRKKSGASASKAQDTKEAGTAPSPKGSTSATSGKPKKRGSGRQEKEYSDKDRYQRGSKKRRHSRGSHKKRQKKHRKSGSTRSRRTFSPSSDYSSSRSAYYYDDE